MPKHRKVSTIALNVIIFLSNFAILVCALAIIAFTLTTVKINFEKIDLSNNITKVISSTDKQHNEEEIKKAEIYNSTIEGSPLRDNFSGKTLKEQEKYPKTEREAYKLYSDTLDYGDGIMGTVKIPAIHVSLPIYHGSSDEVLAKGVGHLYGTSLPVGGKSTHAVITAHSGLANFTAFDNLPKVKKGDYVEILVGNKRMFYKVYKTKVVYPTNLDDLKLIPGKDIITLITCYPYGINNQRWLTFAERVDNPNKAVQERSEPTILNTTPLWILIITGIALLVVAIYLFVFIRKLIKWIKKTKKKNKELEEAELARKTTPIPAPVIYKTRREMRLAREAEKRKK